jgi:4-hydroxy-tetrahydrodipicolinate reductase
MGERVRAAVAEADGVELVGALESIGHAGLGIEVAPGLRVVDDARAAFANAEVAIDFSVPRATCATLPVAADCGVAYVCGTTGFSASERAAIDLAATRVPVVWAPNFSIAVNVLAHLVGSAARLLGPDFDAEIMELHHAAKRDAPSGTALRLAEAIAGARGQDLEKGIVAAREGEVGARPAGAIGIQALRGGDNPGEHSVFFLGRGERLELVHRAATRDHFAAGALRAARWLRGRAPGLYTMDQVLGLENGARREA